MKLGRALVMVVGAVAVHVGVTACSGGDGKAHADTAKTAQCTDAGSWVRVDLPGLSASDIMAGYAYGTVNEQHDVPGATLAQLQLAAGDGFAFAGCVYPGTVTVIVP